MRRADLTERIWLNTADAAVRSGRHPQTIVKALNLGELHGSQRTVKGRWRIHVECLDAWVAGERCTHQARRAS